MRIPRNPHIAWFVAFLAVVGATSNVPGQTADPDEVAGQVAEQAGRSREAFARYLSALQRAASGSDADQRLREKIIKLAQQLKPVPPVPEDAERHVARGRAAAKLAKDTSDFGDVITEFEAAIRVAPWLPEPYYNLGIAQNKLGKHDAAIHNLKLYLLAAPGAEDAKQVRDLVYEIEYNQEKLRKQEDARRDAELQRRVEAINRWDRIVSHLRGSWSSPYEGWGYDGNPATPLAFTVRVSGDSISITSGRRANQPDCEYHIEGVLVRDTDSNGNIPFSGTITGCFSYERCKTRRGEDVCDNKCCLPKHTIEGNGTIDGNGRSITFQFNDPDRGMGLQSVNLER